MSLRIDFMLWPNQFDLFAPVHTRRRAALEFHGCYWHGCPECRWIDSPKGQSASLDRHTVNDDRKRRALSAMGVPLVVVWEHDLLLTDFDTRLFSLLSSV